MPHPQYIVEVPFQGTVCGNPLPQAMPGATVTVPFQGGNPGHIILMMYKLCLKLTRIPGGVGCAEPPLHIIELKRDKWVTRKMQSFPLRGELGDGLPS